MKHYMLNEADSHFLILNGVDDLQYLQRFDYEKCF